LRHNAHVTEAIDLTTLLTTAEDQTGLADWGDDETFGGDLWREGLRVLVDGLNTEARLHEIGRFAVNSELTAYLTNRLKIVDHHRSHPQIREQDVTPPIVIIGQARTGTTLIFDLLAQDPAHRVPLTWEVDSPIPPPRTETYATDPRIAESDANLAMVDLVLPNFRAVHQMGALLAQECVRITGSAFTSVIFPTQYYLPTYMDWVLHTAPENGAVAQSYVWHRRFLEVLQSEHPGQRWLIKTPGHTWTLPHLLAEYPEAVFVQTHRDPARVMASVTSLMGLLYQLGTEHIVATDIAEMFAELILDGSERTAQARASGLITPDRVVDLQLGEIMSDPIGSIRATYAHFGWELTEQTVADIEHFIATHQRDSAGHEYVFADTGLDLADVRRRTALYEELFAVRREVV
jgi:hypothetical protein